MPPEKKIPFGSDDYDILDLSGQTLDSKEFAFAGSYVQALPGNSGPIHVALGAAGSGAPKRLKLEPGDRIVLADPNRPFQSLYISVAGELTAKLLIANSGIEVIPGPGNVDITGQVNADVLTLLNIPTPPSSLTDEAGVRVPGRAISLRGESKPTSIVNWTNLPGAQTKVYEINLAANKLSRNDDSGPPTFRLPLSAAAGPGSVLYPAAPGDIIYILDAGFVIGSWGFCESMDGTMQFLYTEVLSNGFSLAPPSGAYAGLQEPGKVGVAAVLDFEYSDLGAPINGTMVGNINTASSIRWPMTFTNREKFLAAGPAQTAAVQISLKNHIHIVDNPVLNLELVLPWVVSSSFANTSQSEYREFYFQRTDVNIGTNISVGIMRPAIQWFVDAILLRKGIDF